ncbi:hypothetical protein [Falsiroseomonas sp.]|uniref:hypothetical protein n=1 Tax=Falsiroseomonas sp. TaxID=2870721 RepID=UPI003F6F57DE
MSSPSRRLLLLAPLALAACTGLPQPFRGRPGAVARRLRMPPGYRVAVPNSTQLLLTDADSASLSRALAEALVANEVPAVAGPALPLDWQLVLAAEREGGQVVPRYALRDADGRALGMLVGQPVPARDWAEGGEALHARISGEVAPQLATLVGRIDAQRRTGDERASGSGPPVLRLLPVRGAPGDGNRSLTARMRDSLAGLGFRVQEEAEGAQFAVQGEVTMAPSGRGQQRVEIVWVVSRRDGEDLGRVLQLNEVPTGTLGGLWGDVAYVVAEEASGGIRDVVFNAGGFPTAATPGPTAATPGASPAAAPAP